MNRSLIQASLLAAAALAACADDPTSPAALEPAVAYGLAEPNIVVVTQGDAGDGTTTCTLREAIQAATSNAAVGSCAAGQAAEPDLIGFDPSLQSIVLNGTRLVVESDLVIDGGEHTIIVNGGDLSQVFYVGPLADVEIRRLRIIRGSALNGGGIRSDGTLRLVRSRIENNWAQVSGGGIYNNGDLTILESTIEQNRADAHGGGVIASGPLTVENSSIRNNQSRSNGGGIYGEEILVRNSTISRNTADESGGGIYSLVRLTVESSTITENKAVDGSGIYMDVAPVSISSTIIAGNIGDGADCEQERPFPIRGAGQNLIGRPGNCLFSASGEWSTISPTAVFTTVLGPYGANGGPTSTYALRDPVKTGSPNPAIDNGKCGAHLTTDQRGAGFPRVIDVPGIDNAETGNGCDIGAFELQWVNTPPVANAGMDRTVECEADGCADVTLDGSGSSDADGDQLTYLWTDADGNAIADVAQPEFKLELGTHTFALVVNDGTIDSGPDLVTITVRDATAPVLTVGASSALLWGPNHKYHTIRLKDLGITATDACDAAVGGNDAVITKVTSDEPEDADGDDDGITADDIVIQDCRTVRLRAERDETGNGRVYTLHLAVTDASGNTGTATYAVGVPLVKDGTVIDDGEAAGYSVTPAQSCPSST